MIVEENKNIKEENKIFKTLGNIIFIIFMGLMAIMIFMVGQSRLTGREPSILGHRIYIVDSGSMVPTLPIDSMIIVKETLPGEIEKNDIVTYYSGNTDSRVTHRVVEVKEGGQGFVTRGDANNTEDSSILQGDRIIGKLVYSIPYIGKIFRELSGKIGIALVVILGAMWIIGPKLVRKFI